MNDNESSSSRSRPKWKQWLIERLDLTSQSRDDLWNELQRANEKNLLSGDAVGMIQGVMEFGSLQVRDIMTPRPQVEFIYHDDDLPTILKRFADTEHSRYPVIDESHDNLVGVLLAKDLLRYIGNTQDFEIDDIVRPALIVPETQPLNRLLSELRDNRVHMAMVIDEYSSIAGIVTFEDVLEQIVGDIDDEHDDEDAEDPNIIEQSNGRYVVQGMTPIEEFNELVGTAINQDLADTMAGIVIKQLGKIPRQGEEFSYQGLHFKVLRSDMRRVLLIEVLTQLPQKDTGSNVTYLKDNVAA